MCSGFCVIDKGADPDEGNVLGCLLERNLNGVGVLETKLVHDFPADVIVAEVRHHDTVCGGNWLHANRTLLRVALSVRYDYLIHDFLINSLTAHMAERENLTTPEVLRCTQISTLSVENPIGSGDNFAIDWDAGRDSDEAAQVFPKEIRTGGTPKAA